VYGLDDMSADRDLPPYRRFTFAQKSRSV